MKKDPHQFLRADVIRILKIKGHKFNQWLARGFIKPENPADGSGTRNVFSIEDLCRIKLFDPLAGSGGFFSKKLAVKTQKSNSYV